VETCLVTHIIQQYFTTSQLICEAVKGLKANIKQF